MSLYELPESKIVTSVYMPDVHKCLSSVAFADQLYNKFKQPAKTASEFELIKPAMSKWLFPALNSLEDYEHIYTTAGITEALLYWIHNEDREIYLLDGDYSWIHFISKKIKIIKHWSMVPKDGVLYLTNPSAIDGSFRKDWSEIVESGVQLVLDCAYIGTAKNQQLMLSERIEKIFYSFSKNFCLSQMRVGWVFSRKEIPGLEKIKNYNYFSGVNVLVTQNIINHFPFNKLYHELSEEHLHICQAMGIIPSDSVLLGFSENPKFIKFQRGSTNICRIPLGGLYTSKL